MNLTNITAWIEALESGDYKQTKGRLRQEFDSPWRPQGFCCLGVACDVSGLDDWDDRGQYLGASTHLPVEVADWLGILPVHGGSLELHNATITTHPNYTDDPCEERNVINANDDGATFEQIAAALRIEFNIPKTTEGN